jgi:predicted  nucleic acid-binding Zn-ribbon protein
MEPGGLIALYRLHEVDAELGRLRAEAGSLDTGAAEAQEAKRIVEASAPASALRDLHAEQNRLETEQGTLAQKAGRLEAALLDGSLHSQKDRDAAEAELAQVRARISANDDRLLQILEEEPAAALAAKEESERAAGLEAASAAKMRAAKARHAEIKRTYDPLLARRSEAAAAVPDRLLRIYEPIRAKLGSGMADVTAEKRCGACGMLVPEKSLDMVRRDELVQCESCRRILFRLEQSA